MDKLELNAEGSVIKSMSIAFPEGKIKAAVAGIFFKMRVKNIDPVQFRNLKTISVFYSQEVEVHPSNNAMIITLTDSKNEESEVYNEL